MVKRTCQLEMPVSPVNGERCDRYTRTERNGDRVKRKLGPLERLFPMPCPLVVGGTVDEADTLAVAWINIVSSTPPTIVMGLRESRHTLELLRRSSSFTVNVPRASQSAAVDYCGLASGKNVNKFERCGLTLHASSIVDAPFITECPYNIECRLVREVEVGSYSIVFGEIVEVHADEDVLVSPDSDIVDIDRLDPLVYIAGAREYRRLGEKVSDAFAIGKTLGELK